MTMTVGQLKRILDHYPDSNIVMMAMKDEEGNLLGYLSPEKSYDAVVEVGKYGPEVVYLDWDEWSVNSNSVVLESSF